MGLLTAERMAVLVAGDPILAIRAAAAAADPLVMPEHARASAPLAGTVATLTPEDRALVQWAHDPASQPLFAAMEGRRADYARLTAPPPWAPSRDLQQLSSPGRRWWWLGSDLTPRGKGAEWIPLLNTRHKLSAVGPLIPWGGGRTPPSHHSPLSREAVLGQIFLRCQSSFPWQGQSGQGVVDPPHQAFLFLLQVSGAVGPTAGRGRAVRDAPGGGGLRSGEGGEGDAAGQLVHQRLHAGAAVEGDGRVGPVCGSLLKVVQLFHMLVRFDWAIVQWCTFKGLCNFAQLCRGSLVRFGG